MASTTRWTSRSGADAPAVSPTVRAPASQPGSISVSSSTRWAAQPARRATSTRRFEFDEFARADDEHDVALARRSARTASWRFCVA